MNELALFAGAGGGILGGKLLGWRTVCAVEWEPYAACVLAARQNDGLLPPFPIWSDVQTFDGRPWRGIVDVVSGGFPCQDISAAGKGAGIDGSRSGMWHHMARIVGEIRPNYVFVENSPMLLVRGLGTVLADLASMGYVCRWGVLGAADVGLPHQRDRVWLVAYSAEIRQFPSDISTQKLSKGSFDCVTSRVRESLIRDENFTDNPRKAYELAGWVDRLAATGNGQVPLCAVTAWRMLTGGMSDTHNVVLTGARENAGETR